MADEKWQKVREIFDSALRLKSDERRRFVYDVCGDDKTLLAEVESLLSSHDGAESFMETPAVAKVAGIIEAETKKLETGKCFGHYEIIKQIGEGGMGEVYLAKDTKLDRKVAIKILNEEFSRHESNLTRFIREAKAASSLNHPNILVVHEIGEYENTNYIVSEFIEGKTLREILKERPLKLSEVLDISIPIADALCTAHSSNIIHRDIKPDNVMIRPDGLVKLLDFGIAKLTEKKTEVVDAEAATAIYSRTTPGMIIGTAAYVSPEQARGLSVDARSDIFSFGLVLYEMLSGKRAFAGENAMDVISSILQKEPVPLSQLMPAVPHEIERIVGKALRKDCDERYQTATDLLIDLKDARQELEFEAKLERRKFKDSAALVDGFNFHPNADAKTHILEVDPTAKASDEAPTTNIAEYSTAKLTGQFHRIFSTRRSVIYAAVSVTLMLGAFAYLWYWRQASVTPQAEIKSLAVLPLKSLDAGENYLGLGIADAVIRRINQTGKLIVRPTSAVRRYLNEETDALTAARQLNADAVLEGSVQRADDRLRVSVNLLRTSDGLSLWADNFDMKMTDIFTIQDTVAQQVTSRLHLQLDPSQQARLIKRYTSNPIAYEFYVRGVYSFDQRGWGDNAKPQMEATIDLFKKAIEADPNFALAHAQLASAYAWTAIIIEPTESVWAARAKEEINRAQTLDSQLAETHLARYLLLASRYEDYQNETAVRALLLAQQLNPNVGHAELGFLYYHIGLEDLAARELQRALEIDPTTEFAKGQSLYQYLMTGRYDEWLAAHQTLYPNDPISAWYFLGKGRLEEAQRAIEEFSARKPDHIELPRQQALLFALRGDFRSAEAMIPAILSKHPPYDLQYHHAAHDIACIYALEGKSDEAVRWLREAAAMGFPCYPLFERDAYLNRIRQAPEFIQFMAEMKAQNERYRREFAQTA